MPISTNNLKVGNKYSLYNYSERIDFQVLEITIANDFICKDVHTLEVFSLKDVLAFGVSKDYDLTEFHLE